MQNVEHRQGEAGGLAGAGLRTAQHVTAHQHEGDRLLLDWGGLLIAHLVNGAQDRLGQAEGDEAVGLSFRFDRLGIVVFGFGRLVSLSFDGLGFNGGCHVDGCHLFGGGRFVGVRSHFLRQLNLCGSHRFFGGCRHGEFCRGGVIGLGRRLCFGQVMCAFQAARRCAHGKSRGLPRCAVGIKKRGAKVKNGAGL